MSLFCNKTLREISTKTWSNYLVDGKPIKHVFVHSQCRSRTFLSESRWKACFCAYSQCRSSAYLGRVYVILILKACQTSYKGQQSLTKLNTYASNIKVFGFPNLNIYGIGRNFSFVMQELIMIDFSFFKRKYSETQFHFGTR